MKQLEQLFEEQPQQWGLRGDPFLWEKLKDHLKTQNEEFNTLQFEECISNYIECFVNENGQKVNDDIVFVESFPAEGMSGGRISLQWWNDKGIPFLLQKFRESSQK